MGFVLHKKSDGLSASSCTTVLPENSPDSNKKTYFRTFNAGHTVFSRVHSNKGFTIIELLVVLVIIGILMTMALMNSMIARDKARIAGCEATMETVKKAMGLYITDKSVYPAQSEISSYNDIIGLMKENIDLTPNITCEEPFVYITTAQRTTYTLQTQVHYIGSSVGGVKIILTDGEITEKPI
jgi:general secretion pathway protein G